MLPRQPDPVDSLIAQLPEPRRRLFACECAMRVLYRYEQAYAGDTRPRQTIEMARCYALGQATAGELDGAALEAAQAREAAQSAAARIAQETWDKWHSDPRQNPVPSFEGLDNEDFSHDRAFWHRHDVGMMDAGWAAAWYHVDIETRRSWAHIQAAASAAAAAHWTAQTNQPDYAQACARAAAESGQELAAMLALPPTGEDFVSYYAGTRSLAGSADPERAAMDFHAQMYRARQAALEKERAGQLARLGQFKTWSVTQADQALRLADAPPAAPTRAWVEQSLHAARAQGQPPDLSGLDLSELDLSGLDFSQARLLRTYLYKANLHGANMRQADLSEAILSRADLSQACLAAARLKHAWLSQANLSRADLSGVMAPEADLRGANLAQANLNGSNLSDALLNNADLSGANLKSATLFRANLKDAILTGVRYDAHIQWPRNQVPPELAGTVAETDSSDAPLPPMSLAQLTDTPLLPIAPQDYLPLSIGTWWHYQVYCYTESLFIQEVFWPLNGGRYWAPITRRSLLNRNPRRAYRLDLRIRREAMPPIPITFSRGVQVGIERDELAVFDSAQEMWWGISDELYFECYQILGAMPDKPMLANPFMAGWTGRMGYSQRIVFFNGQPGMRLSWGDSKLEELVPLELDTHLSGYKGIPLVHIQRNVFPAQGTDSTSQGFSEEMWYAPGKGLVRLEQKVAGRVSMVWTLAGFGRSHSTGPEVTDANPSRAAGWLAKLGK